MYNLFFNFARKLHPARIPELVKFLLKDEAISGKLILAATGLALLFANTALSAWYHDFLQIPVSIGVGSWYITMDLLHWVNEGLMAIFFLVVGLELKREVFKGDLRHFQTAILPASAAIGGMMIPALIYLALTFGTEASKGWAIPMATDIAIAIGILALLGDRVPASIRLFLLTLAVVDDIGAVMVIALFYNQGISFDYLIIAGLLISLMLLVYKTRFINMGIFLVAGVLLWIALHGAGIHASITGAIMGLLVPLSLTPGDRVPVADRLERATIPLSTLFVVPLFAFVNTGILLAPGSFQSETSLQIAGGVIIGLVVGKMIGIAGVTWLMVKLKLAYKPDGANWSHIVGVALLAGIGFTVSIFVTDLSFVREEYIIAAKLSIFVASFISAVLGLIVFRFMSGSKTA